MKQQTKLFSTKPKSKPRPKTFKAKTQAKQNPKPKQVLPTLPLKKSEIKLAQVYWNNYGASALVMFMVTSAIMAFLIWAVLNKNPVQFVLFLVGLLCAFFLFELVRIVMDSGQKKKIEIIGTFNKQGKSADNALMKTNYMLQKVAGHNLLFPPEVYFSLDKGDQVRLFCTPIFKIVVGCEVMPSSTRVKK